MSCDLYEKTNYRFTTSTLHDALQFYIRRK